jgi:hypothetical protein
MSFKSAWRPRMRSAVEVPYWIVGVLTIVGIYFSVLYNSPAYFFWAALVLAVIGVWWPGPRYSWAALVGFGVLPALLLSLNLLGQVVQADWSCSQISFRPGRSSAYGGPSGETVYCSTIPAQLIVTVAVFWATTLLGVVALLYVVRRARTHADTRECLSGLVGIGVILLVVVAGIAFRAKDAAVPPPPEERAGLPPNGLPVSCPEGEEDTGYFNGVGDRPGHLPAQDRRRRSGWPHLACLRREEPVQKARLTNAANRLSKCNAFLRFSATLGQDPEVEVALI